MKNCIFIALSLVIFFPWAKAQRVVLNVPEIKQNQTKWCWAATAEMIDKFHYRGNTRGITQCDIVKSYYTLNGFSLPSAFTCNDLINCNIPRTSIHGNILIPYTSPAHFIGINYHSIFLNLGYYSSLDNGLNFKNIKDEILACKPLALGVTYKSNGIKGAPLTGGDHIVAIKGYDESVPIDSILVINDPDTCSLCNIKMVNLRALKTNSCIDTIRFFLAGIRQKRRLPCENCEDYIQDPFKEGGSSRLFSIKQGEENYKQLLIKLDQSDSISIKVSYIDLNLLGNKIIKKDPLNSILTKRLSREVFYYNQDNYVLTKYKSNGEEIIAQVKKCRYPLKYSIYPKGHNKEPIEIDLIKNKDVVFEIIRMPGPFYFEFYSFTMPNGKKYVVPANDYPGILIKGKPIKLFNEYSECSLINKLRKELKLNTFEQTPINSLANEFVSKQSNKFNKQN